MWCFLNYHFPQNQCAEKELCWKNIHSVLKILFFFFAYFQKFLKRYLEKNIRLEICVAYFVKGVNCKLSKMVYKTLKLPVLPRHIIILKKIYLEAQKR